jgi:DNA-binding NarL/FixJ family response regulator
MENETKIDSVIIADNQDITAAGILFFIQKIKEISEISEVSNKKELTKELTIKTKTLVILDYTSFDFSSVDELIIFNHRFPTAHFLLFSEELTDDFLKRLVSNNQSFSVLLKDCSKEEVNTALQSILKNERFICNRVTNQLLTKKTSELNTDKKLTSTEQEILKLVAMGKSTKEIAAERFLSVHTVITHRKNIFRKLEVNNVHEATKYALKAGILDAADYYI